MGKTSALKSLLIALFAAAVLVSCGSSSKGDAQDAVVLDSALMIPPFTLSTTGDSLFSSQSLDTKGLVLIKYFSPDCNHCQDEATLYVSKKDSLKNIKTVWVAGNWNQLWVLKDFEKNYKLTELNPIVVGKEPENALLVHYKFRGLPYSVVYKDNQLLKTYAGSIDFSELIAINDGTYTPEPEESAEPVH